ncbi:adenylyltransferase/cytidyltransferase family protein [Alkalispirochaeta alkalica]|uniref:adenylyltransferase/cytidyltransferase family protein n=1 Tax=Alkalispirochaeta alkalica TaxID=46356 RepID=UPI00036BC617|nr:adenylyltransferase/cytidyltransferase family protein [Alkalispirochaeta alkalica]
MIRVFTNGVFDLFHEGHFNLLRKAKSLGDYLLVGVASDESCEKYKRRPFQDWEQRAEKVRSIPFVDEVIKTPWSVDLKRQFYIENSIDIQAQGDKGSSFRVAEDLGVLRVIGTTEGISTTKILRILNSEYSEVIDKGFLNDVRKVFFEGEYYIIKYGNRTVARKYPLSLPKIRIKDEYAVISAFRSVLDDPSFIVKPVCSDENELIIFESAPDEAESLFDWLIEGRSVDEGLFLQVIEKLAQLHNATYNNDELRARHSNNECFHEIKVGTQCLKATDDGEIGRLISSFIERSMEIKSVLLHGDFAPKNILVWTRGVLFIDFEESGYSDPALDIGYFIAHIFIHGIISNNSFLIEMTDFMIKRYASCFSFSRDDIHLVDRINVYVGIFLLSRVNSPAKADYISAAKKDEILSLGEGKIKLHMEKLEKSGFIFH